MRLKLYIDLQILELVLQDDRHPVGIGLAKVIGDLDARVAGHELDIEMVLARGRAEVARDLEHDADHAPQRGVHEVRIVEFNAAQGIAPPWLSPHAAP